MLYLSGDLYFKCGIQVTIITESMAIVRIAQWDRVWKEPEARDYISSKLSEVISVLEEQALKWFAVSPEEVVIRDAKPEDFKVVDTPRTAWEETATAAGDKTYFDMKIGREENKIIGIIGFLYKSGLGLVERIKLYKETKPIYDFDTAPMFPESKIIPLPEDIAWVIVPGVRMICKYTFVSPGTTYLRPIAVVAEKEGVTLVKE